MILTGMMGTIATQRLQGDGVPEPDGALQGALLRYGLRRFEASVQGLLANDGSANAASETWHLTSEHLPELLALAGGKTCAYQRHDHRDLFCAAPAPDDTSAIYTIDGRKAAPTSTDVCRRCALPDADYLCSHLTHPSVTSGLNPRAPWMERHVIGALCDLGKPEVDDPGNCRPGGHPCWRRVIQAGPRPVESISPLGLAESFDVLDALWRLVFGSKKRLLALNTATGSAALALGCANRAEFESRLSALADVISKLKVDRDILPADVDPKDFKSVDLMERALFHKLPAERHPDVGAALQTLRKVCQARNAIQHGTTQGGGFTAKLRELGIHDAPPDWPDAWERIRAQTANSLTAIRTQLRDWVDTNL